MDHTWCPGGSKDNLVVVVGEMVLEAGDVQPSSVQVPTCAGICPSQAGEILIPILLGCRATSLALDEDLYKYTSLALASLTPNGSNSALAIFGGQPTSPSPKDFPGSSHSLRTPKVFSPRTPWKCKDFPFSAGIKFQDP